MKGLKEFLEVIKENEGLRAEVEKVQDDSKKVVEIAKKNGYSFTEDEYMDAKMDAVSGGDGSIMSSIKSWVSTANNYLNGEDNNKGGNTQGQGAGAGSGTITDGKWDVSFNNGILICVDKNTGQKYTPTSWGNV